MMFVLVSRLILLPNLIVMCTVIFENDFESGFGADIAFLILG